LQQKKEVKSFSGLLYRIARNSIIDLYRSRSTQPESLSHLLEKEEDVGDQGLWVKKNELSLEHATTLEALKKLKQEYREVLTLRYVDELTVQEIAEIVGKNNLAVRVTIHRALKKLKQITKSNHEIA
jgi:RNA polymerase sigma-70 factor (ECF subfamily)